MPAEMIGQQARIIMHAMDTLDYWLYPLGLALVVALVALAG
jgi:hypothetical protein